MDKKIRLLYVGFNRNYINRTNRLLLHALELEHVVDYFGPGYTSEAVINLGLNAWIDSKGEYDLLLFDHYVIMHEKISKLEKPFLNDIIEFNHDAYRKYASIMEKSIKDYVGKKCFIANLDVYSVDEEVINTLANMGVFIIDPSMSTKTLEERSKIFGHDRIANISAKGWRDGEGNDNWVRYIKRNLNRVIRIPHIIGPEQISFSLVINRKYRLAVPGASYVERKNLYSLLTYQQRGNKILQKVSDKIYNQTNKSMSFKYAKWIHHRYDAEILNSKFSFVSGSLYRSPVRKYFEVPALGAAPIGQIMEGFSELGFIDGHNFLIAENYEALKDCLSSYKDDHIQEIASNARQMIIEKHTLTVRSKQLSLCIKKICAGSFSGSNWSNGVFMLSP